VRADAGQDVGEVGDRVDGVEGAGQMEAVQLQRISPPIRGFCSQGATNRACVISFPLPIRETVAQRIEALVQPLETLAQPRRPRRRPSGAAAEWRGKPLSRVLRPSRHE
jgi:hypothetical protein